MSGGVWVITCQCGWSRMVPRSTPPEGRRKILDLHQFDLHPNRETTHE